jgi:hypothetical protein
MHFIFLGAVFVAVFCVWVGFQFRFWLCGLPQTVSSCFAERFSLVRFFSIAPYLKRLQ